MGRPRFLSHRFDLHGPAWRIFVSVALLTGLSFWCTTSTTLDARTTGARSAEVTSQNPAFQISSGQAESRVDSVRDRQIKKRLVTVAVTGVVLLLLLAFGYGYLRLELTTRGFYSGRLQIAVGIASLSVITGAYFFWRWLVV